VLRLLIAVAGLAVLFIDAYVTGRVSLNPATASVVMVWGWLAIAFSAAVGIAAVAFGIYRPIHDWLGARSAER
jgi:hypothetical protein